MPEGQRAEAVIWRTFWAFWGVLLAMYAFQVFGQEDPRKEYLRLQATKFCSVVKVPPKILLDAVKGSFEADPQTWMPVMEWLDTLAKRYKLLKCGDV